MTVEEWKEKKLYENAYVVDVRTPPELKLFHFKGNHNFNLYELEKNLNENKDYIPRDQFMYLYCKIGARGSAMCSVLLRHGYNPKNLCNLEGGALKMKDLGMMVLPETDVKK